MDDLQTPRQPGRPLPIVPGPADDEVLASYLMRVAGGNGLALNGLFRAADARKTRAGGWTIVAPKVDRERLGRVLSLDDDDLARLEAVPPYPPTRGGKSIVPVDVSVGFSHRFSRACLPCLAENEGAWLKQWRVLGVLGCPKHNRALVGRCSVCDSRWFAAKRAGKLLPWATPGRSERRLVPLDGWRCHALVDGHWCGTDLRRQESHVLPDEVAEANRWLLQAYGTRDWWDRVWRPMWRDLIDHFSVGPISPSGTSFAQEFLDEADQHAMNALVAAVDARR